MRIDKIDPATENMTRAQRRAFRLPYGSGRDARLQDHVSIPGPSGRRWNFHVGVRIVSIAGRPHWQATVNPVHANYKPFSPAEMRNMARKACAALALDLLEGVGDGIGNVREKAIPYVGTMGRDRQFTILLAGQLAAAAAKDFPSDGVIGPAGATTRGEALTFIATKPLTADEESAMPANPYSTPVEIGDVAEDREMVDLPTAEPTPA